MNLWGKVVQSIPPPSPDRLQAYGFKNLVTEKLQKFGMGNG